MKKCENNNIPYYDPWNAIVPYYDKNGNVKYTIDYSRLHPFDPNPTFDKNGNIIFLSKKII